MWRKNELLFKIPKRCRFERFEKSGNLHFCGSAVIIGFCWCFSQILHCRMCSKADPVMQGKFSCSFPARQNSYVW
uniref:Uncharacterized protein n=1 Tax=Ascaris lumbricoides TaxID=6252 RepID=A0A0M3I5W5_ASCLU